MNRINKIIILFSILIAFNLIVLIAVNPDIQKITGNFVKTDTADFPEKAFVSKVIDGDTVIIAGESVRLLGIDSDEKGYDCYNPAKKRLEELILNKEVRLEKDNEDKGIYHRRLRYIFLDNKNINLQMVEEGFAVARSSPENEKYKQEILSAEISARENKKGCKWEEKSDMEEETKNKENLIKDTDDQEYDCSEDVYNCGDFKTHEQAQKVFEYCGGSDNDVHQLDIDKDGKCCESLK